MKRKKKEAPATAVAAADMASNSVDGLGSDSRALYARNCRLIFLISAATGCQFHVSLYAAILALRLGSGMDRVGR